MSNNPTPKVGRTDDQKALLAFIAVCILWGSTYLAIRIGVQHMPPMLFAGIRFIISGSLMFAYVIWRKLPLPQSSNEVIKQAIVGLFLLFGGNGLIVWAEQWVASGSTSLIVATVPLFMALIELLVPNRPRIDWLGWLGLFIGFAGVAYLILSEQQTTGVDLFGGTLVLLGALSWAFGSVYSKGFKTTGSIYAGIGVQMLAAGCALSLTGLSIGEAAHFQPNQTGLLAMLYLIVFGSIVGYSSYIYLLQKWPAAKAGTYAYINPVVAVFLGAVILGEPLSVNVAISTAIILSGVYLVQRSKMKLNA